jgi:salicylate hydroxylase
MMGDADPKRNQMFVGYHGHVLTFPIANPTLLNGSYHRCVLSCSSSSVADHCSVVAFSSRPTWTDSNWVVQTSRKDLREDFKHWSSTVRSLMKNLQKPDIWALFNHPPAPTHFTTKPLICLVGDAAHASTPHQGAGAGMCIEDAWIFCQVLSQCRTKPDIAKAFRAYDMVRRPRSQMLVKTSKEAGMLWEFEGEDVGDDLDALERNAVTRMEWI